ncbi:tetratricopeptide repeat protein [Bacteriovoracaceae bacterium]|nr:tetratricopeptide repeat protein [Bacteriovoracaceae bacterium]
MADMYKVKLTNGRIVGPIDYNQIYKLIEEELLKGEEYIQSFPSGDWNLLKKVFSKEFQQIINKTNYDEDPLFEKLDQLKKGFLKRNILKEDDTFFIEQSGESNELSDIAELKDDVSLEDNFVVDEDISKNVLEDDLNPLGNLSTKVFKESDLVEDIKTKITYINDKTTIEEIDENIEEPKDAIVTDLELDASNKSVELNNSNELILDESDSSPVSIDKTKIISKRKILNIDKTKVVKAKYAFKKEEKEEKVLDPDQTEVISSSRVKEALDSNKLKSNESLIDENDQKLLNEIEEKAAKPELSKVRKKGKKASLGLILVVVFVIILFFPTEDKKTDFDLKPLKLTFSFPIEKSVLNSKLSDELFLQGKEFFKQQGKLNEIASRKFFHRSLEENYQNNPSLAYLLIIYTKHHDEFKDIKGNYNILHKMAETLKINKYESVNALALSHYYHSMGKNTAAIFLIKNFLKVKKSNPSRELFALYLKLLLKEGELEFAKDVYDKLHEDEASNLESYYAKILYQKFNSLNEESFQTLTKALNSYPYESKFVFEKINLYLLENDIKNISESLDYIKNNIQDLFVSDTAKYFMYKGIVKLQNEGVAPAQKYFQQSLRFQDSPWLRSKLSNLNESGFKKESLYKDNKIKDILNRSKMMNKSGDWNRAFKLTSEALLIDQFNIDANVYMNKLLLSRNLYKQTLINLQKAYKATPKSVEINAALLEAYIKSYQIKNAKKLISTITSSAFKDNSLFYPLFAMFYRKIGDLDNSLYWLNQALANNPLDDISLAKKSDLFLIGKKFDKSKEFLNKAIELNPTKMEYYLQYANILMEYDSIDTAIGYLLNLRETKFPNDPTIKGEIGMYYLRNGQLKYFRDIKKELEKEINQPKNLHLYLVKVYQIDNNNRKLIESAKKVLEIDPLDIEIKALLAKTYFEAGEEDKSLKMFKELEDSLETYPNVQYYIGRGYFLLGNLESALEYANKEISFNPMNDLGYLLKAEVFIKKENYNEAENSFKLAQRYNQNSIDAIMGIANINFKRGQFDIALSLYQKALRIVKTVSKKAEIYKLQGDVYRQLGQSKLAIESYRLFQEIEPDSKYNSGINDFIKMSQ